MSSAPTPEEIARDARWLAQALDPATGMVRLVAMEREAYRASSFLDDRILQAPVDAQIVAWRVVEEAMSAGLRQNARWIFHIGHVGSTLVSRLLGELDGVLAIREPRLLRDLALSPPESQRRYLAPVPKLMSRTFAADEIACVKVTSFASEIAPQLVPPGERALFMYATPRNYIASILAGENSLQELRMLAGPRAQRANARDVYIPAQNDADHAAAAWAAETTALEAAAEAMADRQVAWADFDKMLRGMEAELARITEFFGFAADADRVHALATGPLMSRYSKAPEHEYSAGLRQELLAESSERFSREIVGALAMLHSAAEKSPLLARALARAREV
ncbi:MAG: hypothetical protein ABI454_06115 [Sphingomicrobium sp.]